MKDCRIRIAKEEDATTLLEIYAPYVENTAITFEYVIPSIKEFEKRIHHILEKYPFLIAEKNGEMVGYAYANAFKERAAYDWAVETTLYVKQDKKRMGIGIQLYYALENVLRLQNILNLNACIAVPIKEDNYLTRNSVAFHEHLGYRLVGEFNKCGYKFNRWYNVAWMEKQIGDHGKPPLPIKSFSKVRDEIVL